MAYATANLSTTTTLPQQLSSLDHLQRPSPPSPSSSLNQISSIPLRHPPLQSRHHLRSFSHDPNPLPDRPPNSSPSSPPSTPRCILVHPASPENLPASSPSLSSPGPATRMGYFCPTPASAPPAERKAGRPLHQKARSETGVRLGFNPPSQMLRKKSGEVVRSSLKPASFAPLSPVCGIPTPDGDSGAQWRSAPSTPSSGPKVVHFDAHLEHVRHFLAQQRPIAVSRDGSPIETETEGEEEFPFPAMASQNQNPVPLKLVLETPNFPTRLNRIGCQEDDHVRLKSLDLSQDAKSLKGTIEVSNIAFEKLVAIRFTFDNWQTVSEVTGEYIRSHSHNSRYEKSDLFGFTIKLQDVLVRIEERKMEIAVRYSAGGREFWDNNQGRNFQVRFKLLRPGGPANGGAPKAGQPCPWSVSLRAELDRLVGDDLGLSAAPAALAPPTRRRASPVDALAATTQLKAGTGFSARYDFGLSLKQASGSPGNRNIDLPGNRNTDLPALVSPVPKGWTNGTGVVQLAASSTMTTTTTTTRRWAVGSPKMPPSPPHEAIEENGEAAKESCGANANETERQRGQGVPQSPSLTDESV